MFPIPDQTSCSRWKIRSQEHFEARKVAGPAKYKIVLCGWFVYSVYSLVKTKRVCLFSFCLGVTNTFSLLIKMYFLCGAPLNRHLHNFSPPNLRLTFDFFAVEGAGQVQQKYYCHIKE